MVARSSAEAEFRALTLGICESLWLKMLLAKVGFSIFGPSIFLCLFPFAMFNLVPMQTDLTLPKTSPSSSLIFTTLMKSSICIVLNNLELGFLYTSKIDQRWNKREEKKEEKKRQIRDESYESVFLYSVVLFIYFYPFVHDTYGV